MEEPEQITLEIILNKIIQKHKLSNKKINKYYVYNEDEPYAHKVLQVILEGETNNQPQVQQIVRTPEEIADIMCGLSVNSFYMSEILNCANDYNHKSCKQCYINWLTGKEVWQNERD